MTAKPEKTRECRRPALRIDDATARRFAEKIESGISVSSIASSSGFSRWQIGRAIARVAAPGREHEGRARGASKGGRSRADELAMRPRGIVGEAGTPQWFLMCALTKRAAGRVLRGVPHRSSGESAIPDAATTTERREMLLNPSRILADLGIEIADPRLRDEALFALGQESAADRIRRILTAPIAKSRPFSALRLALESEMPPGDVLEMLAEMPPERGGDSDGDAGDAADESETREAASRGARGVPPPGIAGTGGRPR